MTLSTEQQTRLKLLPGVDTILETLKNEPSLTNVPQSVIVSAVRLTLSELRSSIIADSPSLTENNITVDAVIPTILQHVGTAMKPNLTHIINATGVVVHTNLGRSLLSQEAIAQINAIGGNYSNLEFDLNTGKRGSRYSLVEEIICEISGAESAMVVNNNAAAVLLSLDTISKHKEVIVSRGELVEIGGSFRIPDVMAKSGSILKEVGTTNRTHIKDYKNAITEDTALFLKVHTSNYKIIGFTADVSLKDMVALGKEFGIPVMEDLGSGTFVDFSKYGLHKEPTVQESVSAGIDIVTFSGDKLLGGPQAGIIVGKKSIINDIKLNPLTRALRIDKLTLASLEATLRLYRDEMKAIRQIPTLDMLTMPIDRIEKKAQMLSTLLKKNNPDVLNHTICDLPSKAGGGSLPELNIPSKCVGISLKTMTPNAIERHMRSQTPPIIGRIEDDKFFMDMRTVQENEVPVIADAISRLIRT